MAWIPSPALALETIVLLCLGRKTFPIILFWIWFSRCYGYRFWTLTFLLTRFFQCFVFRRLRERRYNTTVKRWCRNLLNKLMQNFCSAQKTINFNVITCLLDRPTNRLDCSLNRFDRSFNQFFSLVFFVLYVLFKTSFNKHTEKADSFSLLYLVKGKRTFAQKIRLLG